MVANYDGIEEINEIRTIHIGPEYILVTASANFDNQLEGRQVEQATKKITREIKETYPLIKKVFIEAEELSD